MGNKLDEVGTVFTGVLEVDFEGDWNKFAAALETGIFVDVEVFAFGEHNKSSSWLDVS